MDFADYRILSRTLLNPLAGFVTETQVRLIH